MNDAANPACTLRVRLKVSAGVFGCSSLTAAAAVKIVGVSERPSSSSAVRRPYRKACVVACAVNQTVAVIPQSAAAINCCNQTAVAGQHNRRLSSKAAAKSGGSNAPTSISRVAAPPYSANANINGGERSDAERLCHYNIAAAIHGYTASPAKQRRILPIQSVAASAGAAG